MIGCYKRLMKREGASLLSSLAQTLFGNNVITVNFRDGLREPMCEPIFLKQFREEDIFDIIFNRASVSFVLNLDRVIESFRERGAKASWLSSEETSKLIQQSKSKYERPFVFKATNRVIAVENEEWSLYVGDGSLRRIFFDSVLPSSVVSMLLDALNSQS
jgi:arsenate reductase-like glutaredoxin family protein